MRLHLPLILVILLVVTSACASAAAPTSAPSPGPSETSVATIPAANATLPHSAEPTSVQWSEAEAAIKEGKVKRVTQTHGRQVLLLLRDGSSLAAEEPALDDVIRLIRQCGKPCDGIMIATE